MKICMISALAAATVAVAGCKPGNAAGEAQDSAAYQACKEAATTAAPTAAPAAAEAAGAKAEEKAAVPAKASDPAEVMVSVNGKTLTRGEIDGDVEKEMAARGVPADQKEAAREYFSAQVAQKFIMKTLLLEEAAKKGVKVTAEDRKKQEAEILKTFAGRPDAPKSLAEMAEKHPFGKARVLKELEDELLVQKLLEQEVVSKVKVDEKKIAEVVQNVTSNSQAAAKKALDAEAKIKTLAKQLEGLKGDALAKKFAELAKAHSECPSKEKGGDLGPFTRGQMVKEFSDVAFKSEPFVVSAPVKTQFGWHLVMVTKKIPAVEAKGDAPAQPEKVQASHILVMARAPQPVPSREQVEKGLKQQESRAAMGAYFEALRTAAKIEAPGFPNLLPKPAAKAAVESKPVAAKPAEAKK